MRDIKIVKKNRIFLGTTEIAGYYRNLSRGFDILGLNYKYVQLSPHTCGYGSQSQLPFLIQLPYWLAKQRMKISVEHGIYTVHKKKRGPISLLRFLFYTIECLLRIFVVLPWAILNFDIFCFGARSNIVGIKMGYWDITLLKFLGKKIIFVYHGSDSRPPYINGSILHDLLKNHTKWENKLSSLTKKTKNAVKKLDNLAEVIIDNPYSAHFHHKAFINWFSIGSPFHSDREEIEIDKHLPNVQKVIKILHAPTHRIAKGSDLIEACIKTLQNDGYNIELTLIHGRPHIEVIREIHKCDFVIDELYSDALMAGFATEASFYGKPVIVCGYVDDDYLRNKIPTYYCRPESLRTAIIKFIQDPNFRYNLGKRAKNFVESEWSYIKIAQCYKKIFDNTIPKEWYFNPNQINYLNGFGINEQLLKKSLLSLIKRKGISVLQLDDKPDLRDAFLEFSGMISRNE